MRVLLIRLLSVLTSQLIAVSLRRALVDLRGLVIDGMTQFLAWASCPWLIICSANLQNKV